MVHLTHATPASPLVRPWGDGQICLAATGYTWTQHFPQASQHTVTTMFDASGQVVQWYIDLCARHGLDADGIPWWDDLYLDIVVPPTGPPLVRDADELATAARQGLVSPDEVAQAWHETTALLAAIAGGHFPLLAVSQRHRTSLPWPPPVETM